MPSQITESIELVDVTGLRKNEENGCYIYLCHARKDSHPGRPVAKTMIKGRLSVIGCAISNLIYAY